LQSSFTSQEYFGKILSATLLPAGRRSLRAAISLQWRSEEPRGSLLENEAENLSAPFTAPKVFVGEGLKPLLSDEIILKETPTAQIFIAARA
jgi:hypothetical protein